MAGAMSDVTGYRSDGRGMGSDRSIAPQVSRILTGKLPLLNTPGSVIENVLYYDVNSSSVSAVEMQETFGKDKISLTSTKFGGTPTGYIPSVLFCNTTFVQFECHNISYPVLEAEFIHSYAQKLNYQICWPQYWGFWAIENIILYMGASSIAQIQLDGHSNFMFQLACCETESKRRAMLNSAGRYMNNCDLYSSVRPIDQLSSQQSFYISQNFVQGGEAYPGALGAFVPVTNTSFYYDKSLQTALVPIRLPFSAMVALEKRLSLDAKLSTQPIQITLTLRDGKSIFQAGPGITAPTEFSRISYVLWQQELSDKSLSVRNELLAMPSFNIGYPWQYAQSYSISPSQGAGANTFVCNLSSIINADLTTFMFMLVYKLDESASPLGLSSRGSPMVGLPLRNIQLILNGQRYFVFDEQCYTGATLAKHIDAPGFWVERSCQNGATLTTFDRGAFAHQEIYNYIYEFNNSRLRAIVAEAHMQNTGRFTNQTWQLSFEVDIGYGQGYRSDPVTGEIIHRLKPDPNNIQLHMMYLYNSVFLIGGDGGTTKLITQ